jgi:phage-related tail protein
MTTIDMEKQETMKRYAEVFQELNNERKMINQSIKETRDSYVEAGDLSKEEIKQVERAVRLLKGSVDLEELAEVASAVESKVRVEV